uniref:DM domain-containing protein n=1 Tax=Parastrongyloides trichosuri TaxID=131310 RepID=A0A0N4Z185_PARTI
MVSSSKSEKNEECKKILAITKRIPKDVKRHCGVCRQHGFIFETRGHLCEYKNCSCDKCKLIKLRRDIMSTQIKIRRAQDKRFQRTNDPEKADIIIDDIDDEKKKGKKKNTCYFCQKCKNHGEIVWKKDHKKVCPYNTCNCESCELIETRRKLDQEIKVKINNKKKEMQSVIMFGGNGNICLEDKNSNQSIISQYSLQGNTDGILFQNYFNALNSFNMFLTKYSQNFRI